MEEMEPPVSDTEYRRELGLLSDEELLKDREGDIEDEGIPWNEAFPESEKGAEEDTAAEPVQREKANETETSEKDIAEKAREIPEDSESLEKSPVVRRIRFEDDTGSVSDGESTVNNAAAKEAAKEAAREPARSSETGRVTESISESEIKREALPETKNASESTVKKADVPANERSNTKTNEAAVKSSTENVSKKNAMVEEKTANVSEKAVEKPTEKAAVDANVADDSKAIGDVSTSSVSAENSKNTRINAIKEAAVSPNEALKGQGRSNAYSDEVYRDLTKKSVKAAEALSGALGVDIKLFGGENGIGNFYDSGDNVLYLNANGDFPLQYELRRGLMTMLASSDSSDFAKLREFLVGKYKETFGKDAYTEYAEKKRREFSENGLSLDEKGVNNELCADLGMRMLSDVDAAKAIAKELRTLEAKKLLRALEMLSKTEEVNFDFLPTAVESLGKADMQAAEKMFLDALFRDDGGTRKNSYALDGDRSKADVKNNSTDVTRAAQKAESHAADVPVEPSVREDMSREASPLSNAEAERVENVPQTESDTSKRAAKPQTEVNSKETAEKAKNESVPEVNSKAESEIASDGNDGISEEARGVLETIRRTAQSPKEALKSKKQGGIYSGADEQTIRVAEDLSKAFGVRILLFDGNGKTDIDGFYDRKANSIYLNAGSHAKPLQATVRHEMIHFLAQANKGAFESFRDFVAGRYAETYGKEALNTWLRNKQAEYEAAGIELDENSAKEELCADLAMDMLTDPETVKGFAKENRSAARRILDALRRFIDKIRAVFGLEPKYTAGKARALEALSKTDSTVKITDGKVERSHASFKNDTLPKALNVKDLYTAEKLLYQALTSAEIRNSNTNSDGIRFSGETDSDTDIITVKDIDNLRSIGRKSVNDFTSEDIKKAEPFARRYFKELGVKSPFFRAWLGDWRAADIKEKTDISVIPEYIDSNEARKSNRGIVSNKDTGWDIMISREGETNTISHSGSDRLSEYGLAGIKQLIENAILLDCEVHELHSNNNKIDRIAFDHKLYALGNQDRQVALYKITVEEYFQSKSEPANKKFHNLKYIEKVADLSADALPDNNRSGGSANDKSATTYSISDLYALVKTYDKDFHAKEEASKVVDADGKPLVVYHGTKDSFTEFILQKESKFGRALGDGFYFTSDYTKAHQYANGRFSKGQDRGGIVMPVYLNMRNPYIIKADADRTTWGREYRNGDYDGIIDEKYNTYYVESPTQIKSATDNIGTFDGSNPDIRYSKSGTAADTKKNVFSYEALTAKPDMPITKMRNISESDYAAYRADKSSFVKDMVKRAALFEKNPKNTDTQTYIHNKDTGKDILVSRESFRHGAARMDEEYAQICKNIGSLLQNAVAVNELQSRDNGENSTIFIGMAENKNNYVFVRMIAENRTQRLVSYDILYSIRKKSAKKEDVGKLPPDYTASGDSSYTSSTISIAKLLENVKREKLFSGILSADVKKALGIDSTETSANINGVMYSLNTDKDSVQTIPKGEDPARDVDVRAFDERGGKVSEGVRTVRFTSICKRRIRLHRSSGMS